MRNQFLQNPQKIRLIAMFLYVNMFVKKIFHTEKTMESRKSDRSSGDYGIAECSVSNPDPDSKRSVDPDPDPGGQKLPTKRKKLRF
jgi:hypothetical protein